MGAATPPVLMLVYRRPEHARRVFDAVREARPGRLFVAADGPAEPADIEECERARAIAEEVDWDCEVRTLFRESNLGCREAVSSAITWFFEHVESGIILEEDTVPGEDFFWFCGRMLERYREDPRVWSISGNNQVGDVGFDGASYCFSRYAFIWGWATWREAWEHYDPEMSRYHQLERQGRLPEVYPSWFERWFRSRRVNNCASSWAIPWSVNHQTRGKFSVVPRRNLIENIGLGGGTHTVTSVEHLFLHNEVERLERPLIPPECTAPNRKLEKAFVFNCFKRAIVKRLPGFLRRLQESSRS